MSTSTPRFRGHYSQHRISFLAAILGAALFAPSAPRLRADPPAPATDAAGNPTASASVANDSTVTLSEFRVSDNQDKGYLAGNSVSGTRINTPIKDLPFMLDAFDSQFISDIGSVSLNDIVEYAPGVSQATKGAIAGDASYVIRGFQQAPEVNGFLSPNSTGQTNTSGPDVDAVAIDRVEVVKGPASLLYGQVNPGGTVNYITKVAMDKPFAAIGLEAGSYNFWRTTADINQPLIPGTLLFRINFAYTNDFQWIQPYKSRTTAIVPTMTWKIFDRLSLKLDYSDLYRFENPWPTNPETNNIVAAPGANGILGGTGVLQNAVDLHNPGLIGFYPLPFNFNPNSVNDWRRSSYQTYTAELDYKISDKWIARINGTRDITDIAIKSTGIQSGSVDLDVPASYTSQYPTYAQAAQAFANAIAQNPLVALQAPNQQMGRNDYLREAPGDEMAIQGEITGKVDLGWAKLTPLVGAYYDGGWVMDRRRQSGAAGTYQLFTVTSTANEVAAPLPWDFANQAQFPISQNTNFNATTLPLTTFTETYLHDRAAYATVSGKFFDDRLDVIAGIRYNESDQRITNYLTNPTVNSPLNPTWTPLFRETKPTYQFASGYKLTRDSMVYASFSESYFANTDLPDNVTGPVQAKPTTAEGYEVGYKTDFYQGRVSSTICVYDIYQYDRPIGVTYVGPTGAPITTNFQGDTDRSRGIEGEITFSPTDYWQIYISASEDDFRTITLLPQLAYYLGTEPQNVTKTMANLWTRYNFQGKPLSGLWVGGGINYSGPRGWLITNPVYKLPGETLVNFAAGYDWKMGRVEMSTRLNWDNATNVQYYETVQEQGLPSRIMFSQTAKF